MRRDQATLTELARLGFAALSGVRAQLDELVVAVPIDVDELLPAFARAADPDEALSGLLGLARSHPDAVTAALADATQRDRLIRILGASVGLADFFQRHPGEIAAVTGWDGALPDRGELVDSLLESVGATDGFAAVGEDDGYTRLRVRYRRWLARIAAHDLAAEDPREVFDAVAVALSDAAAAALEASIAVARTQLTTAASGPMRFDEDEVRWTRFAVIGMGKAGAGELNYVSDVDVIFVAEGSEEHDLSNARAVDVATRIAMLCMRGISQPDIEPELWEVDPNLRPEGKQGALVRTLDSHLAYYERWAKSWEFQALLKARAFAGDVELGQRYVDAISPLVWSSAGRENFVGSVQRMRERVTENIPTDEVHYQLKLGPGGLRDVEFTVQLLQLVHGSAEPGVRVRGTIAALNALSEHGFIGREEAAEFAADYRLLRVLEHRLQLHRLRRTHLMPRDADALRVLARASTFATTGDALVTLWERTKHEVRALHERLFYRPLLSAVASLPEEEVLLSPEQAGARLAAIGFLDPLGALKHIAALTSGMSRRAIIQRNLLPVMLRWLGEGADPDYGLLAFRRLSESLGTTHWFLRMLRDSSSVAEKLTRVLSGSRYIGELLDQIPEAVAWLEQDSELRPRSLDALSEEISAILRRHDTDAPAATAIRRLRRREILRLALGSVAGPLPLSDLAQGLTDVTTATIDGLLRTIRRGDGLGTDSLEFAVIGMGRYGGAELGFGSDADVMYVYRTTSLPNEQTHLAANRIISELNRLSEDARLPLDLDVNLRPEGKNGPVARSLDSYRAYYARWSLTWEAQALLRARGVAGDAGLQRDFEELADSIRYPADITENAVREVRRIKARVENERLPQGADPTRHVKLGRGSLSDVEWFVQLLQLQHGAAIPGLRTTSTLDALTVAAENDLVGEETADRLRAAWIFSSRLRSAMTLWLNKTTDVLPSDRMQLDGIARVLEYPPGSAAQLEQDYLQVTRRARSVFEKEFYGAPQRPEPTAR
ncbi:bifunctional [glutamine synthetase] adenylyltransferase/[glutamine synthetase]-adenylyl-L-tyrosine phosphorylase [Mycetocola manganoxydans]|uniref:Bifunctional [glutamine synthetase] adenylyltransferase/[glutamine synthetase]-adenylyl-L-tyrosine phosphorylase n=1 Tax=Mycetocola manganoxydans TaxID=699879 RepID=A0A3L6ZV75_9MICO|nr:bifunctional [glutamine synthetase] adenylyltransferase/[glutamine synthetase]-adenylyl-L-tyrosine phosphorylase [Mycetocola manganoxydans]RLP71787.1 bifunctional [glutamine synthetase] adenylyltransferase/[glutamine synthetase]-adenylyl-L-tyrosine phosphorylase [Mycetocola manganoxydans]GHD39587.1 glutamate-ammonia-ligase adenylyltransferase [Mycetocola manganoxydans]